MKSAGKLAKSNRGVIIHHFRLARIPFALVLLVTALARAAGEPKYIHPDEVDFTSFLAAPPADGSTEQQSEIATLLDWQNKRTPQEIARCQAEAPADAFYFANILGDWFDRKSLPVTAALIDQASADANRISAMAKNHWNRTRPFRADERIHPCLKLESSASYPSGHAMRGILWTTLLAEMFPEHKDELLAAGKQYGTDRILGGVHYPSDVKAGQELGAAIAKKLLASPQFKRDLERAKAECLEPAAH